MIEGGGLGVFRPEEVGPMRVQVPNGVVDVAVADEAEAVRVAKQYLVVLPGRDRPSGNVPISGCCAASFPRIGCACTRCARSIETLADDGSVLELRRHFGLGMVTALIRVEGRPLGVIANNPQHLAGRHRQRRRGQGRALHAALRCLRHSDSVSVRHAGHHGRSGSREDGAGAALLPHVRRRREPERPVLHHRPAQVATGSARRRWRGGSHKAPLFTVSWPTGEFGGMGLEGAVKLGFRKELAAVEDPAERKQLFDHMVARAYEHGKALNTATHFEIDDVIDPADSRQWIMNALRSVHRRRAGRKEAPLRRHLVSGVERAMEATRPSRYQLLLASLLLLFLILSFTGEQSSYNWAATVVFVAVLLSSLRAVGIGNHLLLPMMALAVVTMIPFRRYDPGGLLSQGPDLLFMAIIAFVVLRQIVRQRVVTLDMVYGAACVYLLVGLCWGKAYAMVERAVPGSFALGSQATTAVPPYGPIGTDALLMYLSFITITTTGYGDITPVSPPARVLCVLEAIVGQLFLTITVARLVGLYTASGGLPVERDRS